MFRVLCVQLIACLLIFLNPMSLNDIALALSTLWKFNTKWQQRKRKKRKIFRETWYRTHVVAEQTKQ